MPGFAGLKLCGQDVPDLPPLAGVCRLVVGKGHSMLFDRAGHVGSGGNSGFQAINLAAQLGADPIVLVGFDMRVDHGLHWHGRHAGNLRNPSPTNIREWRQRLNLAAASLAARGITVLNASPESALTAYPIVPFGRALGLE